MVWVFQPQPAEDSLFINQAREQAGYYLQQVRTGRQADLHLWALATLCQNDQAGIRSFIRARISKRPLPVPIDSFCGDRPFSEQLADLALKTGSPDLLLAAIIAQNDALEQRALYSRFSQRVGFRRTQEVDYEALISRIIGQKPVNDSLLSLSRFSFPHFLLFFDEGLYRSGVITRDYLEKAAGRWLSTDINFDNSTLNNSLHLVTLMRALYLVDNYAEINRLYPRLISEKLVPVSEARLNIYRYLDYSMYRLGFYDRSLAVVRNFSLPLARFLNRKGTELSILLTQGVYLYQIGEITEAQSIYENVLRLSRELEINISGSSLYNNLSLTYLQSGNFDRYLELQFKALEIAKKQNNYSHQFKIYRNLSIVSRKNKDKKSAYAYLTLAQKLAQQYGNTTDLASTYLSLGTYYRDLEHNHKRALHYFNKADSIIEPETHYNLITDIYTEKGHLFESEQKYNIALRFYNQIYSLLIDKEDSPGLLEASIDKAGIFLKQGKLDSVTAIAAQLTPENLQPLDFKVIVKARTVEAGYLIQKNKKDAAYAILKPTIQQVVEWAQNSADPESGFWNVEPEFLDAFELYVNLLIATGRPGEAVLALDQLKTINDAALYQNPMVRSSRLNESELTDYQRLTGRLDQLRKQLLGAAEEDRPALRSRIDRLGAQKRSLNRKITRLADREPVTIREVQNQISGDEVLLHITELNDYYYIATITRSEVRFRKIALDARTRTLFEQAAAGLARGEPNLGKLYRIGKILNISELSSIAGHIILIPDSYLYQLPVDVIPLNAPLNNYSYGEATYLIERYQTEYLTSLNELIPVDEDRDKEYLWDYTGFGISNFSQTDSSLIPLPYARYEVEQIARELNNLDKLQTIVDEHSTEEAFRNAAPHSRIIHLATHSTVSEQEPLFSTIYMSAAGNQTGPKEYNNRIFAYELFEMNLANDLIMLNSCESGSGSYLQGTGVVGISRALHYAGAESLILNLWSVNDMMASGFAVQFYKALNSGDSKTAALRKAKLHFLKQKNANPHYWGPYTMIGGSKAVVHPYRMANLYFAAGFMLYVICIVSICYIVQARRNGTAD